MICQSCRDRIYDQCLTPGCGCQHDNSNVRALTTTERHEFVMGWRSEYLLPRDQPPAPLPLPATHTNGAAHT